MTHIETFCTGSGYAGSALACDDLDDHDPLRLWSSRLSPWNWLSDGKIIGVCAEVVSTLYQRLGFNVDLSYVGPWARCQQKVAKGEVDINICALRNEERAHYSRFTRTPHGHQ